MSLHEEGGASNPALNCDDNGTSSTVRMEDVDHTIDTSLACYSLADEYDENLGFSDSITIVSMGAEGPVLVQRKESSAHESIVPDTEIPYPYVHNPPTKFTSMHRNIFVPGLEINVEIIDYERSLTAHILNPNLYTIKFTHGQFTWTIKKRYNHFRNLHQQLTTFRASLNIPFPTKSHKERRTSFRNMHNVHQCTASPTMQMKLEKPNKKRKKNALPRFPLKPDSLVSFDAIPERKRQLEEYLYNLLNISLYRNHQDTVRTSASYFLIFIHPWP